MAVSTFKILIQQDEKNLARLESRGYTQAYTNIPNRALPAEYVKGLSAIYGALTERQFDPEANTYVIRADRSGVFKALYSPTLFSTEEGGLVLRWGQEDLPIMVAPGEVSNGKKVKGLKFAFKDEKIGKYTEPVLSISYTSDGTVYTLPVKLRKETFDAELNGDILNAILDENPESIAPLLGVAPDLSKVGEYPEDRLIGPRIKISSLPLGTYQVTSYQVKEGGQFGTDYLLQVAVTEPFVAPVAVKVGETWEEVETEISDWVKVKPNTALKKILAAEPIITPENPATLEVLELFEYNGNPAVKVHLVCETFKDSPDAVNLDF